MTATGIVRRIDDLGRVVIPKEIRLKMRIKEGDPLELFMEDDGVLFKKYNANCAIEDSIRQLKDFISDSDYTTTRSELLLKINEMEQILKKKDT